MRTTFVCLLAIVSLAAPALAQNRAAKPLEIYVVDVEGGNATLFVTPSGETVLIDTGNGGAQAARDASRIMEAAKDAGVTKIDHLIFTHWHGDHFGGLAELAGLLAELRVFLARPDERGFKRPVLLPCLEHGQEPAVANERVDDEHAADRDDQIAENPAAPLAGRCGGRRDGIVRPLLHEVVAE